MIKNFGKLFLLLGLASVAFMACERKTEWLAEPDISAYDSYLKIVHASPNFRTIHNNMRDSFHVYVGTNKANSGFLTYGSIFPSSFYYLGFPSGNQLIRFSVAGTVNIDSATIYSFSKKMEKGKRYSLIITDSIKSTNENKQMWIQDNFLTPVPGQYGIRLVNAVVNDTAGKTVELFSVKNKINLFTNVVAGSATGFQYYNVPTGNDTLILRRPGVTTWELGRINGFAIGNQRVYTILFRGNGQISTGTKARLLTSYQNL